LPLVGVLSLRQFASALVLALALALALALELAVGGCCDVRCLVSP